MTRPTVFSGCRRYRYTLWREWNVLALPGLGHRASQFVQFIGLNPSTADETNDDPTIRRCIDFAKRWGFGALCMTNIFAFRATDPVDMKAAADPVGPDNDQWLLKCAEEAGQIVAAWGAHGLHLGRGNKVTHMLEGKGLCCLGCTASHQPKHPLYIPGARKPIPYVPTTDYAH